MRFSTGWFLAATLAKLSPPYTARFRVETAAPSVCSFLGEITGCAIKCENGTASPGGPGEAAVWHFTGVNCSLPKLIAAYGSLADRLAERGVAARSALVNLVLENGSLLRSAAR